jgi:predicted lipoprotein with Yx(FWY)xxD motif
LDAVRKIQIPLFVVALSMRLTRRTLLAASTTSLAATAGCLTGDDTDDAATDTTTDTTTAGSDDGDEPTTADDETTTDSSGVTIQVATHPDHGEILVDDDGMTLYMFDSDTQGELASACTEGCADAWPPLTTEGTPSSSDAVTAELETFEREDSSTQVAANGWPLYYFQNDESTGDATGQGVNDVWWVLDPSGTPVRPSSATPTPTGTTDDGISY